MNSLKRRYIVIILISWIAYLASYLGRGSYGSCLLEIVTTTGIERVSAGMVSSAFALCNAIGQLISSFIINKVPAIKLIAIELFSVAAINLLFPQTSSLTLMSILWGINGFMQGTILCSITKIFVQTLSDKWLTRGTLLLNTIGAVGGMTIYVLSPIIVRYANWQSVFFTVSSLLFATGIAWCVIMLRMTADAENGSAKSLSKHCYTEKTEPFIRSLFSCGAICAVVAAFFIGSLRESVSLWVPSYINDTFGLSVEASTAVTAFVPMLQIFGVFISGKIAENSRNLFLPAAVTFITSGLALLAIRLASGESLVLTLVMFVLNAVSMTAALTFLVSLYPVRCMERRHIARLVGLLNFFVHLGDFAASSGLGWLSQVIGWSATFSITVALSFVGAFVLIIGLLTSKKRSDIDAKIRV